MRRRCETKTLRQRVQAQHAALQRPPTVRARARAAPPHPATGTETRLLQQRRQQTPQQLRQQWQRQQVCWLATTRT
jgi:hypothetical protein